LSSFIAPNFSLFRSGIFFRTARVCDKRNHISFEVVFYDKTVKLRLVNPVMNANKTGLGRTDMDKLWIFAEGF
jgi:hypothetical protein